MPRVIQDLPLRVDVELWGSGPNVGRGPSRPWRVALVRRLSERLLGWVSTSTEGEALAAREAPNMPVRIRP